MSICHSGLNSKLVSKTVSIDVNLNHPLIKLANAFSWDEIANIVMLDLQSTTKNKKWWVGRPLKLRTHLGVYILQQLFNKTDRQIEYDVKDNAAYQLFCGREIVKKWHAPDHTKIEEFRSRLSPETQQKLANHIAVIATRLGFANPSQFDIDSTIQEANIAYPSDISLLTKVGAMTKKVWCYLTKKIPNFQLEPIAINLKEIKSKARSCFFNKSKDPNEKNNRLHELWMSVFKQVSPVLKIIDKVLDNVDWKRMPWNIKHTASQLKQHAHNYLVDVAVFLNRGAMVADKRLSFHLDKICCFNKGKIKGLQFGRAFQLGRLRGNFLIVGNNTSIRMDDKSSLKPMFETHQELFGKNDQISAALDKGYYSKNNEQFLINETGSAIGLQKPGVPAYLTEDEQNNAVILANRRAGIEPLIGHAKHGGQLGRSRMKHDRTTESSGYAAILGFNGRQLIRYLKGAAVLCK
jgi:IS5 family transposase